MEQRAEKPERQTAAAGPVPAATNCIFPVVGKIKWFNQLAVRHSVSNQCMAWGFPHAVPCFWNASPSSPQPQLKYHFLGEMFCKLLTKSNPSDPLLPSNSQSFVAPIMMATLAIVWMSVLPPRSLECDCSYICHCCTSSIYHLVYVEWMNEWDKV